MKVSEMGLSTYFHQYLVIEADALTELCCHKVKVNEDDCFALCSAFCNPYGLLMFDVLAIGPSADHCRKGLEREDMIGILTMEQAADCEAVVIEADERMRQKNEAFIRLSERDTDDDLTAERMDWRLDDVRDLFYPDDILVGIINHGGIREYNARMEGVHGPFLKCRIYEDGENGVRRGDVLYAMPYMDGDVCRLYAMFVERKMDQEEKDAFERIMHVSDKYGITFSGTHMKS